jgi:diacylglycerol kinase family enzyme
MDRQTVRIHHLLSLTVAKQPYYGYGIKVVPKARFDDGKLHLMWMNSGLVKCVIGALTASTVGNRVGRYGTARKVAVRLKRPLVLQLDGNAAWKSDSFDFQVLPGALRLKC